MRWWGNGSINEISVEKAGLKRCPYVKRSPSTTTRTTSGFAVKSIEGGSSESLPSLSPTLYPSVFSELYLPRDSCNLPFMALFFFNAHTLSAKIAVHPQQPTSLYTHQTSCACTVSNSSVFVKPALFIFHLSSSLLSL